MLVTTLALSAGAGCLCTPESLYAQQATFRLGAFHTTYADTIAGYAGSLGAEAAWSSLRSRALLGGSVAQFEGGAWAGQAYASGTRLLLAGPARGIGFTGDMMAYGVESGPWAGLGAGGLFGASPVGQLVARGGASLGGVHRIDDSSSALATFSASLGIERSALSADVSAGATVAGPVRYSDIGAAGTLRRGVVSLEGTGGYRFGDLGDEFWGQLRLAVRLDPTVFLEAGAGKYPADVLGFLHGTFVQLGLRLTTGRLPPITLASATEGLEVRRNRNGVSVVTLRLPEVDSAAIAGEWNDWGAQPLTRMADGRWRTNLRLAPGVYRFVVVSNGHWFVPDGIPHVPDDLGGNAGLLVVPQT